MEYYRVIENTKYKNMVKNKHRNMEKNPCYGVKWKKARQKYLYTIITLRLPW